MNGCHLHCVSRVRRARSTWPFEVRPAGREPHVYAPMCMYCLVRGLVCRAPIHPSPQDTPHQAIFSQALRHGVGVAGMGQEHHHCRTSGRYACTSGQHGQNVRGSANSLTRCDGLGCAARHASIGVKGSRASVWSSGTARGHRYVGVCTGRGADMREDDPGSLLAAHRHRSLHGLCMANTRRLSYQLARRYIYIDACKSLTLQLRRRCHTPAQRWDPALRATRIQRPDPLADSPNCHSEP
jgi:hypothetical protein